MKHDIDLLMDFVEGSLSESDAAKVRQHLSTCQLCQKHESDIRSALSALRSAPSALRFAHPASRSTPLPSVLPRVRQRLDAKLLRVRREPWFAPIIRLATPLAAAVVLIFLLVTMSSGPDERRFVDDSFMDDPASFVMTDLAGQTYDVDLADALFIDGSLTETDIPSGLAHISPYDISVVVDDLTDEELNSLAIALDKRNSL